MLKRTNIYVHAKHMEQLAELGKVSRSLKPAQLVRIAIAEQYIRRATKQAAGDAPTRQK